MPSIGTAGIFTIMRLDNPNLQKMKSQTRLSLKKFIGMTVQILERLGRERTGKGQCIYYLNLRNIRLGYLILFKTTLSKSSFFIFKILILYSLLFIYPFASISLTFSASLHFKIKVS